MPFTIRLDVHFYDDSVTGRVLDQLSLLNHKVDKLMASNADMVAALNTANDTLVNLGTELDKVSVEVQTLIQNVADLTAALAAAGGGSSPEVDAALARVQASLATVATKLKAVDDLVPDAPVTP